MRTALILHLLGASLRSGGRPTRPIVAINLPGLSMLFIGAVIRTGG